MEKREYKIMLVGESKVGKTAIMQRFCTDKFPDKHVQTNASDYRNKDIPVGDNSQCNVIVCDMPSVNFKKKFREYFKSIGPNMDAIIMVYDIGNRNSFDQIPHYIDKIDEIFKARKDLSKKPMFMLVGNKCELNERNVSKMDGVNGAKCLNMPFEEFSARNGTNIQDTFVKLVEAIEGNSPPTHQTLDQTLKSDLLNASLKTVETISDEKLSKLREWIYISDQGGENKDDVVCVSVITPKYAASALHCFPNAAVGEKFTILNVNYDEDEYRNWKPVKVKFVGKDADLIIFGSDDGGDLFASAPLIRQLPDIGTRYIAIGLGPRRPGPNVSDVAGITYTHGMIASNFVDDTYHIMGDTGNNAGYSGGLVLSRKGQHLLGLITSRSSIYRNPTEAMQMSFGEWIEILGDLSQPRSFILSNIHIDKIIYGLEREEIKREQAALEKEREND